VLIVRFGLEAVARWGSQFDYLANYVHATNTKSIRWLKRLGFSFGDPVAGFGHGGGVFLPFYRVTNHV
jgi:hypothetical protein